MTRIALVMIARNEARCIARCLNSVRDHVDSMLVLDTGSDDDTASIARSAGAQVARFAWCDDFAAARNEALRIADAHWSLVLDADEWLVDGAGALGDLRSGAPSFVGVIRVDNLFGADESSASCSISWISRVLPRGARYSGRVHEQPDASWPRRRLGLTVRHDGYLDAAVRGKRGRNENLLRLALGEQPDDAYLHYQLGKDLELCGRYADALPHYQRAHAGTTCAAPWHHDLLLRTLFALARLDRFADAVPLAQRHQADYAESPDYCFALGDLLLSWAAHEPARGHELVPLIEAAWLRAIEIGERPELVDTVRGRGSFLAAHNLAVLYGGLGRLDEAQRWRIREQAMRAVAA
ncbi:MAG TPA: glycosyltransferase family 2 protein [Burkholderiaceae bacterium]|nr:glycosyltransferase family 2 protein [Burkholderiaceae bacterium]